ncbi:MAG: hypothetical protein QM733_07265 [Ilumatobacteraceae bacterium]
MPSPTPPPPLPDPDDDRRLAERRARADAARTGPTVSPRPKGSGGGQRPASTKPAPKRKPNAWTRLSPRAKAIVIATVIVVVVVLVGTFIGRRGGGSSSTIATDDAVSTLQQLLDGVDSDTQLATCPFGPMSSIVGDLGDDISFASTPVESTPMIVKGSDTEVDQVLCSAATPDDRLRTGRSLYVYATPVPTDSYSKYLTALLDGAKVKLEDPRKHAGGTIYSWCVTPSTEFRGGCGADWVADGGGVVFGMQIAGGEITASQISAALEHELPSMVQRFGTDVPSSSVP